MLMQNKCLTPLMIFMRANDWNVAYDCHTDLAKSNLPNICMNREIHDFQAGHMSLMDSTGDINNLHESPIIEICVNERCPTKLFYSAAK